MLAEIRGCADADSGVDACIATALGGCGVPPTGGERLEGQIASDLLPSDGDDVLHLEEQGASDSAPSGEDVLPLEERPASGDSPPAERRKKGAAAPPARGSRARTQEKRPSGLSTGGPPSRTRALLSDASVFAGWLARTQLADASAAASWMARRDLATRAAVGVVVLLLLYALLFGGARSTHAPQEAPEQERAAELPFSISRDLFTYAPRTCVDAAHEGSFARVRCTAVSDEEIDTGMLLVGGAGGQPLRLEDVISANERYLEHSPQLDVMLPKFWRYADNPRHPASVAAMKDGQFQPCVVTVRGEGDGAAPVTHINPRLLCVAPDGQEDALRRPALFEHGEGDLFAPSCTTASICDSAVVYARHTVRGSAPKMERTDAGPTLQYAMAVAHAIGPFLEFLPAPQGGANCADVWREARAAAAAAEREQGA